MRRLLFLLFTLLIVALLSTSPTYARTITVCSSGCDYTSIQEAVNVSASGDTVQLGAETFFEHVIVDKPLTIQGAGINNTVIDGGGWGGWSTALVLREVATISELTVQNAWTGITLFPGSSVRDCLVRDNNSGITLGGGGWFIAPAVIATTTVADNNVGIYNWNSEVQVTRSLFIGNEIALLMQSVCSASNFIGHTSLSSSTVSRNTVAIQAARPPGGFCEWGWQAWTATLVGASTIAYNDDAYMGIGCEIGRGCHFLQIGRSIVAHNGDTDCLNVEYSGGFNLFTTDLCLPPKPTDLIGVDPLLLPLGDNGGPTPTHALHPDSPAIDTGGDECEPTDQRGVLRPQDGDGDGIATCDIGAFEFSPPLARVNELIDQVQALGLHHGIENSLLAKLNAALLILGDLQPDNDHAAANVLGAFIRHVQAQSGKKIAAGDADALIGAAEDIIELLSGGMRIRRGEFQRRLFSPGRRLGSGPQEPE